MSSDLFPIVNGVYLGKNSEMFKVKMLAYTGENINNILIEDTAGNVKSLNFNSWQNMRLLPCCMASPTIERRSSCPA